MKTYTLTAKIPHVGDEGIAFSCERKFPVMSDDLAIASVREVLTGMIFDASPHNLSPDETYCEMIPFRLFTSDHLKSKIYTVLKGEMRVTIEPDYEAMYSNAVAESQEK